MSGHAIETACRNCGTSWPRDRRPHYCPQCGQETEVEPPTFFEFLHEFVGHYVALEGALWRTLALLVLKPGRLTREYFAGRRRRYVLPLRLYLSASFLFFVVVKLLGLGDSQIQFAAAVDAQGRPVTEATSPALAADLERARECLAQGDACPASERIGARLQLRLAKTASEPQAVQQRLVSMAPYTVFLMLPVFAGVVQLAYRRRRMNYGAHFVFSLHMHAFWFVALLAMSLLPDAATGPALGLVVLYGLWALQRVYGGRWWATALRALVISGGYGVLFALALIGMVALAVFKG